MKKIFTVEVEKFIQQNAKGMFNRELSQLVNETFGTSYTEEQIRCYKARKKIKSETGTSRGKTGSKLFDKEQQQFIKDNALGIGNEELTNMLNEQFKTSFTRQQVKGFKSKNNIKSGLDGCFKKGHTPHNKGIKGKCGKGCEKTWFKKGMLPINHRPVGSERIDSKDGYTLIKTAEPKTWRFKHVVLWEQHNGPVPKGYKVIFLDGDVTNITIDNLTIVTDQEALILNKMGLRYKDKDLTKTGINIAKVIAASRKRKNKTG